MPKYFIPTDGADEEPRTFTVETLDDGRYRVETPEGRELIVDAFEPEGDRLHLLEGGNSWDVNLRAVDGNWEVGVGGDTHTFDVLNERQKRMRVAGVGGRGQSGPALESPMAGTVVSREVEVGDEAKKGDVVLIVEAMKMENDLKAHKDGTVASIEVQEGGSVETGDVLVTIE